MDLNIMFSTNMWMGFVTCSHSLILFLSPTPPCLPLFLLINHSRRRRRSHCCSTICIVYALIYRHKVFYFIRLVLEKSFSSFSSFLSLSLSLHLATYYCVYITSIVAENLYIMMRGRSTRRISFHWLSKVNEKKWKTLKVFLSLFSFFTTQQPSFSFSLSHTFFLFIL
jgi:hypothetical protein